MLIVNCITNDPMQQFVLDGIPGIQISVLLRFLPRIQIWNMDITSGSFTAQGIPLVASPNLLRQWRNIIPFGMACANIYKLDPYQLNDFVSGNSTLYLLDSTDVQNVENGIYGDTTFMSSSSGASG